MNWPEMSSPPINSGVDPTDKPVKFEQVIDRLIEVTGARNDSALARALGVSPQTFFTWRKRGTIPFEAITVFAAKSGLSLDYLLLGRGSAKWPGGEIDPLVASEIELEIRDAAKGATEKGALAPDGYHLALIYNRVIKRVKPGEDFRNAIEEEVRFLMEIHARARPAADTPKKGRTR